MTTNAVISQVIVELAGSPIGAGLREALIDVEVENNLHLPDSCAIRFHVNALDSSVGKLPDEVMKDYLTQGTAVTVIQKAEGGQNVVFKGEVTAISLEFSPEEPSGPLYVVLQAYDRRHRLHRGRKTRTFLQSKYSDIVKSVAQEAGFRSTDIDATSQVHDYVAQVDQTNWEFLRYLADRVGYEVYVDGDKLFFKEAGKGRDKTVELEWGEDLVQFRCRASTSHQVTEVTVRGWDPKNKQAIVGQASQAKTPTKLGDGKAGTQVVQSAFGASKLVLVGRVVAAQGEADTVAKSTLNSLSGEYVEAEGVTAGGRGEILPGVLLNIKGVGTKYSGQYYVISTTHSYSPEEGMRTSFVASGRRPYLFSDFMDGGRGQGFGRRMVGVVIGIVTNNKDPEDLGRVKVKFPWLDDNLESDWARIAAPGAGKGRGVLWLPEVDDEVLVAFENGDIHRPYVLGGLWNAKDVPPAKSSDIVGMDGGVTARRLESKSHMKLVFCDKEGDRGILLTGDDNNRIEVLVDKKAVKVLSNGEVQVTGGKITLGGTDIEIKASGGLKINASGNIEISGAGVKVDTKANLDLNAGANLTAKGSAQASLQGGMVEVKGTMVRIN